MDDTIKCRIQYINDLDTFDQSVNNNNREPLKPLFYSISLHRTIGEQLADIIRQLKSPHKVISKFEFSN